MERTKEQLEETLNMALSRIYDILLGDDGQAYKEADRFLKKESPELYEKLNKYSDK